MKIFHKEEDLSPTLDGYHYSRPKVAAPYLDHFGRGLKAPLVLFGRRRSGKTQFLLQDLAPEARERGYRVRYCSLWDNPNHPAVALIDALESLLGDGPIRRSGERITELSLSVEGVGGLGIKRGEAIPPQRILDAAGNASADTLSYLGRLWQQTADKKVLFIIDEVQELAKGWSA